MSIDDIRSKERTANLVETQGVVYNRAGTLTRGRVRVNGRPAFTHRDAGVARPSWTGVERAMSTGDRLDFLRTVPMFAEMDEAELTCVAQCLNRRSFAAGQVIFYQGDPGEALYIIESGRVRIYVHAEDGQEVSMGFCGPGDLFGEMSLIDRRPRSASVAAMEDVVLWAMSGDDFLRHLRGSHQLALNLMLTLSTRLRETTESIKSLASLDVNQRIIRRLLLLAEQQGTPVERGIRIRGRLTQGELASLISASRESTNRALRALERKGLIDMQRGRIVLRRPEELEALVAGGDA